MWLEHIGCDVEPFEGAQHRDRRGDDAIAVNQCRPEKPHDDEETPAFGPVRAGHRHQRQDAAFAVIIGPHDEQAIFYGNGDDQRPEDQRETAERRLRGKVSTGRADDGLQRVERAGSEVTIDNPQCRECRRWCGLASDACQHWIVFVYDVGRHRSKSPCAVKRHSELWSSQKRSWVQFCARTLAWRHCRIRSIKSETDTGNYRFSDLPAASLRDFPIIR